MEFREKPHPDKYKGITNDSNCRQLYAYVISTSPPVWGLEYFDRSIFVAQSVHSTNKSLVWYYCSKSARLIRALRWKVSVISNIHLVLTYTRKKWNYPTTRHACYKDERRYSSYSLLTSVPDGVSGQRHAMAALYSREITPSYQLDGRLGGPQSWCGHGD
jgi:hypothetical protein